MDLAIKTTSTGTEHLVVLCGEMDAFTGLRVKETFMELVSKPDVTRIAVDLEAVEYMDSTGLGIFIAAMKACNQAGCDFVVQNLSPRVERLFRITGLHEIMATRKGESE